MEAPAQVNPGRNSLVRVAAGAAVTPPGGRAPREAGYRRTSRTGTKRKTGQRYERS